MNVRRLLFGLLVLLFGAFLLHRFAQLEAFVHTLRRGQPIWIGLAIIIQLASLVNQTALYQSLYTALKLPCRLRDLLPVVLAGHFLNVVTPSAGLGGTALLLDDARRQGLDLGRVTLANTLYFLLNFIWFALLLAFGLVMLFRWHDLKSYEIGPAVILLAGLCVAISGLILVSIQPATFSRLCTALGQRVNQVGQRLSKRDLIPVAHINEFTAQFAESAQAIRTAPGLWLRPLLHTLLVDGLEVVVLGVCFAAFPGAGPAITLPLLVTGYSIGTLFLVVSITPQGLGVVEGVLAAMFVSFGVPLERAAVVVLVYRGLSFWLPLLTGFLALRWTPTLRANTPGTSTSPL